MSDDDIAGEEFGQDRPPLSEIIRSILDRYPDGQIFKEMIQNADDAGAKRIQFFIDHRRHGTSSLPNQNLSCYQGPALISANDASFSEEDWVGIRKLQRSIKAKDPFKVGKFGIGFNSVYHVTDIPTIISGKRVAYLEPQEHIWSGKTGRSYELSHMQSYALDALRPFENIFGFSLTTVNYPYTLFRFPLRTVPSGLSQVTYTTKKAEELVDALRVEAKLLLLFLRSINSIEVFRISEQGEHSLLFKTCISDSFKAVVQTNRAQFKGDLQKAYARESFKVSNVLRCTSRFQVEVTDCIASHSSTHDWLVVNQAGSKVHEVLEASPQQSAFPLVGAALELSATESPSGGRIFCFLPMPIEIASGLPVHVNGTFGLTDDRRSLKWPGAERKNDLTAKWNQLLVKELLPSCYLTLAIEAKKYLKPEHFYMILPDVCGTQWNVFLEPFLKQLFKEPVVFSELSSKWVVATQPSTLFVPCGESLPAIVLTVISYCGFNIVNVPSVVWNALRHIQVSVVQVSPGLIRNELRSKPWSYTRINSLEKRNLLLYCLSDKNYSDLQGLELIPLSNGEFTSFQSIQKCGVSHVYLCSSNFPKYLLPNLDHKLVDVSNDTVLQSSLCEVASKKVTNLMPLTEENVASLLNEAMPQEWKQSNEVSLPHFGFPSAWFETFWLWIGDKNLRHFQGKFVVPVSCPSQHSTNTFRVVRLSATHSPLYIPSYEQCSIPLQKALTKLQVKYSMQQHFPYLSHQQLQAFLTKYDPPNLLNAIQVASHYVGVKFLEDEAEGLQTFLCPSSVNRLNFTNQQKNILQNIPIFKTASNSNEMLCSVTQAASSSMTNKALLLQANFNLSFTNLPTNLLLFKQSSHHQVKILEHCAKVASISDVDLLVNYIFPRISNASFPRQLVYPLMKEVLDLFNVLQHKSTAFATTVQSLPFLDTGLGYRVCPKNTFDPLVPILVELYKGKKVFPLEPFNRPEYLQILRQCGLHTAVTPQEVVDIVIEIRTGSTSSRSVPKQVDQLKFSRSKAVLCVIGKEFQQHHSSLCRVSGIQHSVTFKSAMNSLAKTSSWLPVLANPPAHYPSCLPWHGRGYNSHVISLASDVVVVGPNDIDTISCLVGSQMFIVSVESQAVADLFEKHTPTKHVLTHFDEIIGCKDRLQADVLSQLVINIYSYLKDVLSDQDINRLRIIQEWIYLRKYNKFVSPKIVALNLEPTFQRNLEPYLFVLPEILLPYAALFTKFGVKTYMTQSQILLVLESIKNRYSSSLDVSEIDSSNAWDIVMSILNWITNNGTKQVSHNETLYVPIQSESKWPQLAESKDVVYTDNDFLKDFLMSCGSDETYTFVDSRVSQKLAECLCLTPISEYLDISEDTFEDSGQHEPLTVRLKNILRDYKDGLTIVKELLQNADDAEATEVNICYDARTHTVAPKSLFFPGMLEAHGPALVVHNNRSFTEDDFKNITKLAGATKRDKQLKIGKFGVGFCSVYHITDVPSFVSQDKLCIFDPTLSVLRKEVKNPSQPGKKVKFTSRFIAQSSQLLPYEGLFDFQPGTSYQGTLFRFPFRSCASELSSTCYTEATVKQLMSAIQTCGSKLLLFLQHVKRITFQRISSGQQTPEVLLTITKESIDRPIRTTSIQEVKCDIINKLHPAQTKVEHWLIANDSAVLNHRSASASVACQLNPAPTTNTYSSIVELDGEVFCYLPLSQKTGLPVHVSSNFAVINNRRGIWTSDEATSKTDTEVQWNEALMRHIIPKAYVGLLCKLQDMNCHNFLHKYLFYSLWPLSRKLFQHNPWYLMVDELYRMIFTSSKSLFYSSSSNIWLKLNDCKFLQHGILSHTTSDSETSQCITQIVSHLKLPIVELPEEFKVHMQLSQHTINEEMFIDLFFKNLTKMDQVRQSRNLVVIHMLEVYETEYDDGTKRCYTLERYLESHACIPCTPDGTTLKHCKDVISPYAPFAQLFDPSEAYFPLQKFIDRHLVLSALDNLKMIYNVLPWEYLIERAQTISGLYKTDQTKALKRVKLLINTLEKHSPKTNPPKSGTTIECIEFLPVQKIPANYHLPWRGQGCDLSSGQNLVVAGSTGTNTMISGSQVKLVCENLPESGGCDRISSDTLKLLHIRMSPTCEQVIRHLKLLVDTYHTKEKSKELTEWCDQLCRQVYSFFDDKISLIREEKETKLSAPPSLKNLFTFPCIWNGETFLNAKSIARNWRLNGPYLFSVPTSLAYRKRLSAFLNIKDEFSVEDVQQALTQIKEEFGDNPVGKHCQTLLRELVPILNKVNTDQFSGFKIMLPDENFVLRWSTELAYNDAPWAPKDTSQTYVNDFISRALAKKLHVRPVRSKLLEKYVSSAVTHFNGVPFGQKEKLTRRISNIIRDYPFDITVLKELLQNADDAKATKMYIILDKRTHGTESVLSENWQKLQGPALLVWNDSTFSEKDLKGIQELGLGSKRSDAESIGQYGIGFNVVYHLTDCPSFISGGETLCIMDPHCKFAPDADPMNPGRRFDNLNNGLWETFSDVKSAYLQSNLQNCPPELSQGSLFRFPLRHTAELVQMSKIVEDSKSHPLTADKIHRLLSDWAPRMKDAMLFLNHVTELKFCIIEASSKVITTENHFQTVVSSSDQEKRLQLHQYVSEFKNKIGSRSCVIMYPLTISDIKNSGTAEQKIVEDKWLIQQGVGDIENDRQEWKFVNKVKPRHGIAAPIVTNRESSLSKDYERSDIPNVDRASHLRSSSPSKELTAPLAASSYPPLSKSSESASIKPKVALTQQAYAMKSAPQTSTHYNKGHSEIAIRTPATSQLPISRASVNSSRQFNGQVFCFLPLPVQSRLPVHINGNFMLNSIRRDLWHATNPDQTDDRSKWNNAMFSALASSYAKFLVDCQSFYVDPKLLASIKNYYQLFPESTTSALTKPWFQLAENVYKMLYKNNSPCLAVVNEQTDMPTTIDWCRPVCTSQSQQVYMWKSRLSYFEHDRQVSIRPILRRIGMKISAAPYRVKVHFDAIIDERSPKLPEVTPSSVYDFYKNMSSHHHPCAITTTPFETIPNFIAFTNYLLLKSEFPTAPYEIPLLLTYDGILRCFKQTQKVIVSKYCQLFDASSDKFLHFELNDVNYTGEYFVQCSSSSENNEGWKLVCEILTKFLPPGLNGVDIVENYTSYLRMDTLTSLWECLTNDPIFHHCLPDILQHWALLLTTDCRLISTQSSLLPVVPPTQEDPNFFIYKLLCEMKMPFLDTSIVHSRSTSCPQLQECTRILKNIHYLHCCQNLSRLLTRPKIKDLVCYLQSIDFRYDSESREYVKSLPLFENTEEEFSSIQGKRAYVWPNNVCKSGYQKWLKDSDTVFVTQYGDWTSLGSAEQLGIQGISPEELYVNFIFPKFDSMTQAERYDHLIHIRENLFDTTIINSERRVKNNNEDLKKKKRVAQQFVSKIKTLRCIGGDGLALKTVSDYYNHKEEIFSTFADTFLFLPEYFTSDEYESSEWLEFFTKIGLHESPTTDEYLQLCNKVANGQTSNLREASSTLTSYLFSYKAKETLKWHSNDMFLHSVSQIPYVCCKQLPNLTWLKPAVTPTKTITTESETVELVRFSDATIDSGNNEILLWTVKPVIQYPYTDIFFARQNDTLLRALNVCVSPCVQDVTENMKHICEVSHFASQNLFYNYPERLRCPETGIDLLKVMKVHFNFLEDHFSEMQDSNHELLEDLDLPCIPVFSSPKTTHRWQVVLVRPQCVLKCDVQMYHPFLHTLPSEFYFTQQLLSKLGVKNAIELSHIQLVLELAFRSAEQQEVEVNTKICVQFALKQLYYILLTLADHSKPKSQQMSLTKPALEAALDPLYLPSEGGKLTLSTQLVYCDKSSYRGKLELSHSELNLSLLTLPSLEYGFYESDFCPLLPKSLRPMGLSEICEQTLDASCKPVDSCSVADQLKHALSIPILAKATMSVIKHCFQNEEACSNLEPLIVDFLSNINVITVQNLQTEIRHKELGVVIGNRKSKFFLYERKSEGYTLYVDSRMSAMSKELAVKEIVEALTTLVKQTCPEMEPQTIAKIRENVPYFLKAESPSDIMEVLQSEKIAIDGFVMDTPVWKLGRKVPKCWHHRLDQDLNNIFNPMEYVGYNENGDIILAQIVHAVLPPGEVNFNGIPQLEMKYKIYTSQNDEEGSDVSVVDLFKFLRGLTRPALTHTTEEYSNAVEFYDETRASTTIPSIDSARVKACKKEIDRILRDIWKLPDKERMSAIRRLYLKWHPDKNQDNVQFAEKIFKYLVSQIELLDKASSSDDPLQEYHSGSTRGRWKQTFGQWDNTAHEHQFFFQRENESYDSSHEGGRQDRRDRSSARSFTGPKFDDLNFQPDKNPQETQRWVQQAEVDFRALCTLHDKLAADPELAGHVCFMAHQVAEKALKGAMYAECGLDERALIDHKLMRHAYALQSVRRFQTQTLGLTAHVSPLEDYYLDPRYPNKCPFGKIPAERFEVSEANRAKEHAQQVLKVVKMLFPELGLL